MIVFPQVGRHWKIAGQLWPQHFNVITASLALLLLPEAGALLGKGALLPGWGRESSAHSWVLTARNFPPWGCAEPLCSCEGKKGLNCPAREERGSSH